MIVTLIFASVLALCAQSRQVLKTDQEVKITVFYESLCLDSVSFINEQLYPTWMTFPDELTISFKPFGKANFTENDQSWDFTCQHGPNECWGNKVQACALKKIPDTESIVPLINCLMMSTISLGPEAATVT